MRTIGLSALMLLNFIYGLDHLGAQLTPLRCLLPASVMDEIIGEASGETALRHVIEMGAYVHDRPASEYTGNFFETQYVFSKIKEYGLPGARINTYPTRGVWDGVKAELWEISPGRNKLADFDDLPSMLAQGSVSSDVKAELVWIEEGSEDDIDKAGVAGKIVVTSGPVGPVHNLAVSRGAVGVVSFDSPRPLVAPLAIPVGGISAAREKIDQVKPTFAFYLPPREGHILMNRLLNREKITVHAVVESQRFDTDLEVTECVIPGTNPDAGEIIFSAHLFEGYVKQGANDNISGAAALLEIARMFKNMIDEGRLARPQRSIRFIFVPEYAGTSPWTKENKDLMEKTLCNLNLDMVGLNLRNSQSFLCLHRTTYGNPHYINDVVENYYRYVGMGNSISLGLGSFPRRIVSPGGTDDPFYYSILDHAGGSDHEVFNDWGI